jgi:hypothetical protein
VLQCLKCFIWRDLLFRELQDPSVLLEYDTNDDAVVSQDNEELVLEVDDSDVNMLILE